MEIVVLTKAKACSGLYRLPQYPLHFLSNSHHPILVSVFFRNKDTCAKHTETPVSVLTIIPVSYTHLDVYKRQEKEDGRMEGRQSPNSFQMEKPNDSPRCV